jgi:hypothetical protein
LVFFILYDYIFRPFDPQYISEDIRDDDDEESKARFKLRVGIIFHFDFRISNKFFSLKILYVGVKVQMKLVKLSVKAIQD